MIDELYTALIFLFHYHNNHLFAFYCLSVSYVRFTHFTHG